MSTVSELVSRMGGIIEVSNVSRSEKQRHSQHKLVHNSKYFMYTLMRKFSRKDVKNAILYIVQKLVHDKNRKRLYVEAVLFDTLHQLFGGASDSAKLIFAIYQSLEIHLSHDMDYWLQRAKSIYRLRADDYKELMEAYRYAKKTFTDGDERLQAKAALSISLICCPLAEHSKEDRQSYELEALQYAEVAIRSTHFSQQSEALKRALYADSKQSYLKL